jgi:hypothetical protein
MREFKSILSILESEEEEDVGSEVLPRRKNICHYVGVVVAGHGCCARVASFAREDGGLMMRAGARTGR